MFVCLFLLMACQSEPTPENMLNNYLSRLSNSLDVDRVEMTSTALLLYPMRRHLQQTIPPIDINVLEFLRLSQCELQRHIGQRNSGLGKVMLATQELLYDSQFIRLAKQCQQTLAAGSSLLNLLDKAIIHKSQFLAHRWWNATFASEEFTYLLSLGTTPVLIHDSKRKPLQLVKALENIVNAANKVDQADSVPVNIEQYYQIIGSSKYIGQLRLSMQIISATLTQANQLLKQRLGSRPLCFKQQPNQRFNTVNTVFHQFYIQDVQRYVADIYQQGQLLFPLLDNLQSQLLSRSFQVSTFQMFWDEIYANQHSEWRQFNNKIKQHTYYWQQLLSQCGSMPR